MNYGTQNVAGILAVVLCMCGCSTMRELTTFERKPASSIVATAPSMSAQVPMEAPVAPVPTQAGALAPDPWCTAVATSDVNRAAASGFDAATLQRMATVSYT